MPDFEERVIDFSEVEQLMNSINIISGTLPADHYFRPIYI